VVTQDVAKCIQGQGKRKVSFCHLKRSIEIAQSS